MEMTIKIEIIGKKVSLYLLDEIYRIIDIIIWEDKRDLSEKLLKKLDLILEKNRVLFEKVKKFDFYCDSPYFGKEKGREIFNIEELNSKGKCGFTSWQIGEITAKFLNFCIKKNINKSPVNKKLLI